MLKVKFEFKNFIASANYLKSHFSFSYKNWRVTHFPIYLSNSYFNDEVKASKSFFKEPVAFPSNQCFIQCAGEAMSNLIFPPGAIRMNDF